MDHTYHQNLILDIFWCYGVIFHLIKEFNGDENYAVYTVLVIKVAYYYIYNKDIEVKKIKDLN